MLLKMNQVQILAQQERREAGVGSDEGGPISILFAGDPMRDMGQVVEAIGQDRDGQGVDSPGQARVPHHAPGVFGVEPARRF